MTDLSEWRRISVFRHNDCRAVAIGQARMTRTCAISDAEWPIKYVSLRTEQKTLGECRECWYWIQHGRSRQCGPSSRRCTRVPESATTLTNSAFCVRVESRAASVLVRINTVFSRGCVRQFGTRTSVAAMGWLPKPEGWDIGYLGNQRGNHSILLAAYHAGASLAARKLSVASSPTDPRRSPLRSTSVLEDGWTWLRPLHSPQI